MIKILLINPNLRHMGGLLTVYPPLGILSIASVLIDNNHDVQVIDADIDNLSHNDIKELIFQFEPEIIGITMTTLQYKSAYGLIKFIKEVYPHVLIATGGVHPSAIKSEILKQCQEIDVVIIGEGEITFLELVNAIDNKTPLENVNGICYRENGSVHITNPRELIKDLDSLPFPALDLVAPLSKYPGPYPVGAKPSVHIMASRGCPFGCQFCSNPIWGKRVRFHSSEYILEEIEWLQKNFGVKEIFFQDDTFNLNHKWLETLCNGIISKGLNKDCSFKAPFRANSNLVSKAILNLLKKAGFWMIFYGVESGDPDVLKCINKNISLEEIESSFYLTKKAGIRTYASFMIGNLSDTPDSIKNTINFAKKINPDFFGFAVTMPYPGSQLFEILEKNKQISVLDTNDFKIGEYIIPNSSFSKGEVEELSKKADAEIRDFQNNWLNQLAHFIRYHYFLPSFPYQDYVPFNKSKISDLFNSCVIMGKSDNYHLGDGWHNLEYWPPNIRWTKESAIVYLKPRRADKSLKISIIASKPYGNQILKIFIGREMHSIAIAKLDKGVLKLPLKARQSARNYIKIKIVASPIWIPDTELNNGDKRKLGIAINKIWTE